VARMNDKTMKKVLPKIVEDWINAEDICFITGKIIGRDDQCRWTDEFDAWVSEDGQNVVEREATSDYPHSEEAVIIYSEWYAKDEASAANEEYRRWHK